MIAMRANKDRICTRCGSTIPQGAIYYQYRERALSSHEACHAGTLYPKRKSCAECRDKQIAALAEWKAANAS